MQAESCSCGRARGRCVLARQGRTRAWLGSLPSWRVVHAGDCGAGKHKGEEAAVEPSGGVQGCRAFGT
eukprot:6221140-Lingulodinium_polyedra.AAC.1